MYYEVTNPLFKDYGMRYKVIGKLRKYTDEYRDDYIESYNTRLYTEYILEREDGELFQVTKEVAKTMFGGFYEED